MCDALFTRLRLRQWLSSWRVPTFGIDRAPVWVPNVCWDLDDLRKPNVSPRHRHGQHLDNSALKLTLPTPPPIFLHKTTTLLFDTL